MLSIWNPQYEELLESTRDEKGRHHTSRNSVEPRSRKDPVELTCVRRCEVPESVSGPRTGFICSGPTWEASTKREFEGAGAFEDRHWQERRYIRPRPASFGCGDQGATPPRRSVLLVGPVAGGRTYRPYRIQPRKPVTPCETCQWDCDRSGTDETTGSHDCTVDEHCTLVQQNQQRGCHPEFLNVCASPGFCDGSGGVRSCPRGYQE